MFCKLILPVSHSSEFSDDLGKVIHRPRSNFLQSVWAIFILKKERCCVRLSKWKIGIATLDQTRRHLVQYPILTKSVGFEKGAKMCIQQLWNKLPAGKVRSRFMSMGVFISLAKQLVSCCC